MDAVSDRGISTVVLMTSSQVGKTECLNNVVGFYIAQDPAPILMVQPTLEMAEAWSKDRLAPMLRDTPALRGKVAEARSRDSGNTLRHKEFPGGHITIAGANSASGLAARPIRILLADEIDRYPPSAGTEGDPVSLARRRTATFWNRKIVMASTPTVKGASRIEAEWELSDKRLYHVPCPHCGEHQVLAWRQVLWPEGKPELAAYHCEHCGTQWSEADRLGAIKHGEWRITAQGNGTTAGFWLSELYSPWSSPATMARSFLDAKGHPEKLKTWINTSLGETWEEDAERVDGHTLETRRETWGEAPAAVLVVTAGVDLQDDRLEVSLLGWGLGEECWVLAHRILYGDPSGNELWRELDGLLLKRIATSDGRVLAVAAACIDTGGHHTLAAYRFCRSRLRRKVFAIKGAAGAGRPIWPLRASKNNKGRVNLFLIGVDTIKDAVFARLRVQQAGPGYVHFSARLDAPYFVQLTAERVQTVYRKGFAVRAYIKDPGARNEALDCFVYGYAAMFALNIQWGRIARKAFGEAAPPVPTTRAETPPPAEPEETAQETQAPAPTGALRLNRRPMRRVYRSSVVR